MRLKFERRSLELTAGQWAALDEIAAQTASLAPSGPTAGQASWRTLIKRIADYEVPCSSAMRSPPSRAPLLRAPKGGTQLPASLSRSPSSGPSSGPPVAGGTTVVGFATGEPTGGVPACGTDNGNQDEVGCENN